MLTFKQYLLAEALPPPAATRTAPETAKGLVLIHGSGNDKLTLDDVQIFRTSGVKQQKRGRSYGGFYTLEKKDQAKAEKYAEMMDGTPTLYDVRIKDGTKLYQTESDVTRLSPETVNELTSEGYGIIVGKDPRGHTEWVIIDKDCVQSISPQ